MKLTADVLTMKLNGEKMSLYNMLFGQNPDADALLGVLGKTKEDFQRFRDIWLREDGYIEVYTRCGGGNREYYQSMFDEMSTHPWYDRDEDDDFDCTYASIYFKIPNELLTKSENAV